MDQNENWVNWVHPGSDGKMVQTAVGLHYSLQRLVLVGFLFVQPVLVLVLILILVLVRSLPHSDVALPVPTPSSTRTDLNLIFTSALPPGIVLQGRHFQHAQVPSAGRKPGQRSAVLTRNASASSCGRRYRRSVVPPVPQKQLLVHTAGRGSGQHRPHLSRVSR